MFLKYYKSWDITISCASDMLTMSSSYNYRVRALDWHQLLATPINNQWLYVHEIRI